MSEVKLTFTYDELVASVNESIYEIKKLKPNTYSDQVARKQANEYLGRLGMKPQFTVIDELEGEQK